MNVDKLYTKMLMQSAGAGAIGGVTVTAASGIEIALWDLVGRILETPVCNLLGGRFRIACVFIKPTRRRRRLRNSLLARGGGGSERKQSLRLYGLQVLGRHHLPVQRRSHLRGTGA